MKKTYTTVMPDKAGAFLAASEIFSSLDLNITRVSYNRAIDVHMLFVEVEGEAGRFAQATALLAQKGYLLSTMDAGRVILIELELIDRPGSVTPILRLIHQFDFNITYLSSAQDGSGYQKFKLGLFLENAADISRFIREASLLCRLRVLDYNRTETVLDNTVFYISFVNDIAARIGLDEQRKRRLLVESNQIMELLHAKKHAPYKTFEYIGKFAEQLGAWHGDKFCPRITRHPLAGSLTAYLIEPPCGSNLCVIDDGKLLFAVDGGFHSYREESLGVLRTLFPDFDRRAKVMALTHADVDHCGLMDYYDQVYLSQKCAAHFRHEQAGKANIRESYPIHAPYVRISKLFSFYQPPALERLTVIGGTDAPLTDLLTPIGTLNAGALSFAVYEGCGGHVGGEIVLIERRLRILFSGDLYVNLKEFTPEQARFNQIAPYLMTSVDMQPDLAAKERAALLGLLDPGSWLLFGGHGAALRLEIS